MRIPNRLGVPLLVLALAVPGCGADTEDVAELRNAVRRSEIAARTFTYGEASVSRAYTVTGAVEDDLRYRATLTVGGVELVEQIVSDDALAVRFVRPDRVAGLAASLGHPDVDKALREGRWVVDPSGAPPLIRTAAAQPGGDDPFTEAFGTLAFIRAAVSEAARVKEFNYEDIEYRPAYDPWVYPHTDSRETRYDLIRPILPKSEEQISGAQGDITESAFRKTSVFVRSNRVEQICSLVDVRGHEDYLALQERKGRPNEFHRDLFQQIFDGETTNPIVERERFVEFAYEDVTTTLPVDAHLGKLEGFKAAFAEAFQRGLLKPQDRAATDISDCDRPADAEPPR